MAFPFAFPELPPPLTAALVHPLPTPSRFEQVTSTHGEEVSERPDDWTEELLKKTYVHNAIFEAREVTSFEAFNLPEDVLRGLYSEMRFDRPSEIQALSLPLICKSPFHSIVAQAQNGSGKTCCFVLCILTRLEYKTREPQALIVVPTRELAIQNEDVVRKMGGHTGVTTISTGRSTEIDKLRRPITEMVVVSTMGTLLRWRAQGRLSFKHLKVVVFDEADVMLDQDGFKTESMMLLIQLHGETDSPQILLFSATFNEKVKQHAQIIFSTFPQRHDVQKIYLPKEELSLDTIAQVVVKVDGYYDKIRVVSERILECCTNGKCIIFVRTRSSARTLHKVLGRYGWSVTAISGEMDFDDRDRVIDEFRKSVTSILVSTDVLARGFDVFDVNVVINFDIPRIYETGEPAYETYLHRVGRSGRFRRRGVAFNLADVERDRGDDLEVMEAIAKHFDREIPELDANSDEELNAFLEKAGFLGIPGT